MSRAARDRPSRLGEEEVFAIFGVIDKHETLKEAQKAIEKLHLPRRHRKTITGVFNVGAELFKRGPGAQLTTEEAEGVAEKAGYDVSRSRVVDLHRLYQLWESRRQEETKQKRPQGAVEEILNIYKTQLFTPVLEDILIDDLGSLGDHSARLRQDTLSVVLQSLDYTAGFKATITATTWAVPRPREVEIFWRVKTAFSGVSVECYCPAERDLLFQDWLASAPSTLKRDIAEWKRLEGSYLADAVSTRMKIHDAARQETKAWVGDFLRDLVSVLPRGPQRMAPPPLTVNFGKLIYQLAVEYCRSRGARGLPDEACYDTIPGDRPPWVKLVLGQPRIPLGNPLPGLVQTWIDLHRRMVVEWGQSKDIGMLLYLFDRLQHIEERIKGRIEPSKG